jgi:membrane fusion protein (multidrug efflux system)
MENKEMNGIKGKEKSENKRKAPVRLGAIVLLVMAATGLVFGYLWLTDTLNFVNTENASIDGEHMNITARILGRIKSMSAAEGDKVEAGQVLVVLDDADLRAQERQAAAALNSARQNLVLSKVNLDRTEEDTRRMKTLYGSGATTKEQYDHAVKALDTADAQYAIAQAQVETANAQLGVIETQLLNTKIAAPIPGVISKRTLNPGDVAQPGQTICTVNNLASVWVTANIEETKIGKIKVDAPVEISVDAYPDMKFEGRVARISSGIVPPPFSIGEFTKTTQRIPVKILFVKLPENLTLLPGMSVVVKVRIVK